MLTTKSFESNCFLSEQKIQIRAKNMLFNIIVFFFRFSRLPVGSRQLREDVPDGVHGGRSLTRIRNDNHSRSHHDDSAALRGNHRRRMH